MQIMRATKRHRRRDTMARCAALLSRLWDTNSTYLLVFHANLFIGGHFMPGEAGLSILGPYEILAIDGRSPSWHSALCAFRSPSFGH